MDFLLKNWKTTLWGFLYALAFVAFRADLMSLEAWQAFNAFAVSLGLFSAADGDLLRKQKGKALLLLLPLAACLGLGTSACTGKGYQFAKYSVDVGLDLAEDAGVFRERIWHYKAQFGGDTLFYYDGINEYLLMKSDSLYTIKLKPDRQALQDTVLYYIKKKQSERPSKKSGGELGVPTGANQTGVENNEFWGSFLLILPSPFLGFLPAPDY